MVYRFVGREADIGGKRLWYGDSISLSEKQAEELLLGAGEEQAFSGAVALLPDDDFAKLKFSDEELKQYHTPTSRDVVTASSSVKTSEIRAKLNAAAEAQEAYRAKISKAKTKAEEKAQSKAKGD